jgi:hypothetical protein
VRLAPEQAPTQKACFSVAKITLSVICACVLTHDLKLARTHPLLLHVWFLQRKICILGWVLVRVLVGILMTNARSGAIWWQRIQTYACSGVVALAIHGNMCMCLAYSFWLKSSQERFELTKSQRKKERERETEKEAKKHT